MCNLCGEDCENVGHFLWKCPAYSERCALFLEHLKRIWGKILILKSCHVVRKSGFILRIELWGSHYKELLCIVQI